MSPRLKTWDFYYKSSDHTGFFATWFKIDNGFHAHVNTIVVSKQDRGKGLASKIFAAFVNAFNGELKEIELSDQSKGFWSRQEAKYPSIRFIFENED